jgi:hypothetical protein
MGRPTDYTPEIAERFCLAIAQGSSVVSACEPKDMPADRTIYRWLAKHEDFCQQYARAREVRAHFRGETIVDIAFAAKPEDVQVAKLQIDTLRWLMGKEAGKYYGDRIVNEHTGGDKPIEISDTEAARKVAFLLAKATQGKE